MYSQQSIGHDSTEQLLLSDSGIHKGASLGVALALWSSMGTEHQALGIGKHLVENIVYQSSFKASSISLVPSNPLYT
jgi:hypothetical protein